MTTASQQADVAMTDDANDEASAALDAPTVIATRSPLLASGVYWALFGVFSALALRPILITAIVADDFLIPAHQYSTGGSSFFEALRIGWQGASSGHFNYLGQIIGAIVGWMWVQAAFHFGVNFSLIFAVTKFIVYVATVVAGARFLRVAAEALGTSVSLWRSRIYVAIALYGTLQIHVAWSNDPTVNYPMSGFASAAIAFWVLSLALPRLLHPSWRGSVELAVLTTASLLYYEVNAAVVVAMLPLVAVALLSEGRWRSLVTWVQLGLPLAVPTFSAVALKLVTAPAPEEAYNGTAISTSGMTTTLRNAIISSLPASAWKLTRDWLGTPFTIRVLPFLFLIACSIAAAFLVQRFPSRRPAPIRSVMLAIALVATVVLYWWVTAAIQAATPKVQTESLGIGYVYNYYAAGATAVAILFAAFAVFVTPRLPRFASTPLTVVCCAVLFLQCFINWNMMLRFNEVTLPNQQVYATYANDAEEPERCEALNGWLQGAWPAYYRESLVNGMQWAHEEYRGEPFCEALMDETTDKPDNVAD